MKTIEQAILDKIYYIGEGMPKSVAKDKRPKFVVLGTPRELINETINKSRMEIIIWIGDYVHKKANPNSKMDVPSIVYQQVEKDFDKFLALTN